MILSDRFAAQTTIQQADEPQVSNSIDPSPLTDTSPEPNVYDSPPTAADQETPAADQETPAPSITNEMSRETGATVNVNDYL